MLYYVLMSCARLLAGKESMRPGVPDFLIEADSIDCIVWTCLIISKLLVQCGLHLPREDSLVGGNPSTVQPESQRGPHFIHVKARSRNPDYITAWLLFSEPDSDLAFINSLSLRSKVTIFICSVENEYGPFKCFLFRWS